MELKDQVCSLESSKRLKELGVEQESYFYWVRNGDGYSVYDSIHHVPAYVEASAFTVAELGWLTPYYNSISFYQWDENEESGYGCHFNNPAITEEYFATSKTEAEARALMLIYLLEHRPTQNQARGR